MLTTMKLKIIVLVGIVGVFCVVGAAAVEAHQSGCHRWHSCPSDTGSYVCGDLGYACQYSTYSTGSSRSSSSYTPSYYTPPQPTCPLHSSPDGMSSCKCNYGYVNSGGSCVSGTSYCFNKHGLFSTYDSLTKTCGCSYGYEMSTYGTCVRKLTSYTSYTPSTYSYSGAANSCPTNSKSSPLDSSKCTCNSGYTPNKKKDACEKITAKVQTRLCQDEFGKQSIWSGKLDTDGDGTCTCKKKYTWNTAGTKCIKSTN